jgi:hypothetical protein
MQFAQTFRLTAFFNCFAADAGKPAGIRLLFLLFFDDACNDTGGYRPAALADSKTQTFFYSDRRDQLDRHLHVVTGHNHLYACRKLYNARNVRRTEVEWCTRI